MEDMDIGQIVDVPDTPDRLAGRHIKVGQSVATYPRSESLNELRGRGERLASENGSHRKLQLPLRQNPIDVDTFEPRSKLTAVSSLENPHRSKNALLFRKAGAVNNSKLDGRHSVGVHRDKQKAQHSKVHVTRHNPKDSSPLTLAEQDEQNRIFDMAFPRSRHGADKELRVGQPSANVNSSLQLGSTSSGISRNAFKGKEKIDFNTNSGTHSAANPGKMIQSSSSSQNKVEKQMPMSNLYVTPPKVVGQKRLVRNGCISPINIASSAEKLAENLRVGSGDPEGDNSKNLDYDRALQAQVDINEIIAEDNCSSKAKGKRPIVHPHTSKKLNTCIADFSDCNSLRNKRVANETNDAIKDAMPGGWKSTHNVQSKVGSGAWCSANEHQESKVVKRNNGSGTGQNLVGNALPKRQKKLTSASRSRGESSTVASNVSDIMFLGSSNEPSTSRSSRVQNRKHQVILDPVYEIDELSTAGRNGELLGRTSTSNVDSDIRARQLEADEVLARELQEQLYNETPLHFGCERSSSTADSHRLPRPLPRSRSSQHAANRRVPQARVRAPRVSQLRSRILSRSPTALPRLRSSSSPVLHRELNLQFPLSMDLDMRLDILENLESALTGNHFLRRDFDENDYEMLLALDNDNTHRTGASVNQISILPESVVQTVNLEETCAVCLESPAVGETIRHLPCFHKFHKDCIDPWLSRKTSCPVCKCSIT